MYGKMWTTAFNTKLEISNMEEQHLINSANMVYRNLKDAHENNKFQHIQRLFDLVQELEYRQVDDDDYDAPNLDAIMDLARKYRVSLIHGGLAKSLTLKPIRRMSQEETEKLWQETEQKILPEGDKDKIEVEMYANVDNITRRLYGVANTGIPMLFTRRGENGLAYSTKKVRVTIEVLED